MANDRLVDTEIILEVLRGRMPENVVPVASLDELRTIDVKRPTILMLGQELNTKGEASDVIYFSAMRLDRYSVNGEVSIKRYRGQSGICRSVSSVGYTVIAPSARTIDCADEKITEATFKEWAVYLVE